MMKEKLENLPLFDGRNKKQTYDFNFSFKPDSLNREALFSINHNVLLELKSYCAENKIEASNLVEKLLLEFMAKQKP